jgi:hypothetical protein
MEKNDPHVIDGTALTSWLSRQKRHNWRYLRQICDKLFYNGKRQRADGLIVWDQPSCSS